MKTLFALSPRQVLATYASHNGGDAHTRALIAMALREGKLLVRTNHRWTSNEQSVLQAWKGEPATDDDIKPKRQVLKRELWWKSVQWGVDILDWDFNRARMMVTTSLDPFTRVMLKGVRFKSDQIREILSPGSLALEAATFSKVHSSEMWRRFWHDVVILAAGSKGAVANSGLAGFKSGDALMEKIMNSLLKEDEEAKKVKLNDDDLAKALVDRHEFKLKEDAVRKEIKALRRTFELKTWGRAASSTRS